MDTAAIYHRPESEYAFLYTNTKFRIRLRTRKNDIKKVYVLSGDPYTITTEKWYQKERSMKKCLSTNVHDYWEVELTSGNKTITIRVPCYWRRQHGLFLWGSRCFSLSKKCDC